MPFWHRLVVVAVVLVLTAIVARLVDRRMARRDLTPVTATRYRVFRRTVTTVVILVGFASQRTIGNFVAGLLIAFTQPIRLGDRVELEGIPGTVEEIGLTYTFIRTDEGARLVIPNEKLASDTILNSTIVGLEKVAEITVQVPLDKDLRAVVELLRQAVAGERDPEVSVTGLNGSATVVVRARASGPIEAERLESDLRIRAQASLRAAGVFG